MTAIARAREGRKRAARRRAERRAREFELEPEVLNLGLCIDPRKLTQPGALELLRIAAGLSYKELSGLTGIPRAHVIRLLRGAMERPLRASFERIRNACWDRMPSWPQSAAARHVPDLLTLEEAARLLAVRPIVARRFAIKYPQIGAVRIGRELRFPSAKLAAFLSSSERPADAVRDGDLSTEQFARLLRVSIYVVYHMVEHGQVRAIRRGRGRGGGGYRFPLSEIARVMRDGTGPIRARQCDLPRNRRRSGGPRG